MRSRNLAYRNHGTMNAAVTIVLAITLVALKKVESYSGGAPSSACDNLMPNQNSHGAPPQQSAVPYSIDLAPLTDSTGVRYTPGQTYTLTLSGNAGEQFRGFLIQTRTVADDSRVGTFTVTDTTNSQLSNCSPRNVGVTHPNGLVSKSSVSFQWTAPSAGTGPIRFRFAVVRVRNTYWADQSSAMVQELVPDTPTTTMSPTTVGNNNMTTAGEPTTTAGGVNMTTTTAAVDNTTTTMGQGNSMPATDGAIMQSGAGLLVLITALLGTLLIRAV